jgi:hypothetical protein
MTEVSHKKEQEAQKELLKIQAGIPSVPFVLFCG